LLTAARESGREAGATSGGEAGRRAVLAKTDSMANPSPATY